MIGDGVCQSECNSEVCEWDGLDCGCAADCSTEDYGTCKEACLVPDCGYDGLPGYPKCADDQLRESFRIIQGFFKSYVMRYSYQEYCSTLTPLCTFPLWSASFTSCVPECSSSSSCLSSFGNCNSDCSYLKGCHRCSSLTCYECKAGFVSFFLECMPACPVTFKPHPLNPTFCIAEDDDSTDENPDEYYVSSEAGGRGIGTKDEPLPSIAIAFAAVHSRFVRIWLLKGVHSLSSSTPNSYLRYWKYDFAFRNSQFDARTKVEIKALFCSQIAHPNCVSDEFAVVRADNLSPSLFYLRGEMLFEGVHFDGKSSLLAGCAAEMCVYCPRVVEVNGVYFDDRQNLLKDNSFAKQESCDTFSTYSFMNISPGAIITFSHVQFTGFRQQFNSLISLSTGSLSLAFVVFRNIQVTVGVIVQSGDDLSGNISIMSCSVAMLNNGFEFVDGVFAGFAVIRSVKTILIADTQFRFNFIGASGAMLSMKDFLTLRMDQCGFENNFGRLLSVLSNVGIPDDLDSNNNLIYFNLTHVHISNSQFSGNSGNSLIFISFQGDIQNVEITSCSFINNLSLSSGLIYIAKLYSLENHEIYGTDVTVKISNSRVIVHFPKMRLFISGLKFEACSVYGSALISLSNFANIHVSEVSIYDCGDISPLQDYYEITLKAFLHSPEVYMDRPVAGLTVEKCENLVYFEDVFGVIFEEITMDSNICENGSAGISVEQVHDSASFSYMKFENNISNSPISGSVLDVSLLESATFSNLFISRNVNTATIGSGIVQLTASVSSIQVADSTFTSNTSPSGGALFCTGSCIILHSVFERNTATGGAAAGLLYSPQPQAHSLVLTHVSFIDNISVIGGALFLTDSLIVPAKIDLAITDTEFRSNVSQRYGSCIYISQSVALSDSSYVLRSRFVANTAVIACVYNSFLSGVVKFDECEFSYNTAESYSVMYSTSPASTLKNTSKVQLANSLFQFNSGKMMVGFLQFNGDGESWNLTVQHNFESGFHLQTLNWQDSDSLFFNNTMNDAANAFAAMYWTTLKVSNTRFVENRSGNVGGALYIGGKTVVILRNCSFLGNFAKNFGGAMYIDQQASAFAYSCTFFRNTVILEGGAIYYFPSSLLAPQLLANCTFQENSSKAGAVSIITANVTLIGCTIHDNVATESPGLLVYLSEIMVVESDFYSQHASTGALISVPASSTVKITKSSFHHAEAIDRGAGVYVSSSRLEISESRFYSLSADLGVAIAIYSDSTFDINSTEFNTTAVAVARGGVVFISESEGKIAFSQFVNFVNGAIVADGSEVDINFSEFHDGSSIEGAALICHDCHFVAIRNSICRNLTAQAAPCYSLRTTSAHSPYIIQNCTFESNRAQTIGALLIDSADGWIEDSRFVDNSAESSKDTTGVGGAVYLTCDQKVSCKIRISQCLFQSNRASEKGGAVYWTRFKPIITNVTFANNTAEYGNNIASFAVKLGVIANFTKPYELSNIPSGQPAGLTISVGLLDPYDQVVKTDNSSLADLFPVNSTSTTVTGVTRVAAKRGIFEFASYEITAKPGSMTQIKIQTTGVDESRSEDNMTSSSEMIIDVTMRDCDRGESRVEDTCFACPPGKYSFDPTQACFDCPTGAICLGKSLMIPEFGYWRSSSNSSHFWKCPNADACLGVQADNASQTGSCAEGYFGNMCDGCVHGYSRSLRNRCDKCPTQSLNVLRVVGIGLCLILLSMFVIKMSLISARRMQSQYSVYLKIFLNYLQMVMLTVALDLHWPSYVLKVFKAQESAGNVSEQVFSYECFISTGETDTQQKFVFLKLVIVSCVPPLIFLSSFLFWGLISLSRRSLACLKSEMVNSIVVLFFIAHPSIVKQTFDIFNCKEINNGEFWMNSYLNIRCWDDNHYLYALAVALPSIILWGMFAPTAALGLLIVNRANLDSLGVKIRFGFLYTGYHREKFYWEFVSINKKVFIIILAVFFTTISVPVQALCVMLVLTVAFILQLNQRPYLTPMHNGLELRGILVAAITIYCGLFFLTAELDHSSQLVLFICIIMANVYFLVYWLLTTCKACCHFITQRFFAIHARFSVQRSVLPNFSTRRRRASFSHSLPASVNVRSI